ncbi:Stp1/IreP family PP2C-type Ser/Thr phosphatase [Pendulispora rubella]|uniref:Stp1/IreP family PP2C-type Ser/Thr phosphatase n=1 Tax=Pendulispora rubella TaxID=2741070 RepID=A0ABZ2LGN0_9BACT
MKVSRKSPGERSSWGMSDVGRKRKTNEDALFVDDELGLYIVADGMGGHAAGEIASREATATIYSMIKQAVHEFGELKSPLTEARMRAACQLMESAIQAATSIIYSMAELDRQKAGMGTTISALLLSGEYGIIGHVGDSRIYHVNGEKFEQLTEDHSLIAWQLKQGLISEEEAMVSPYRNVITRAVGNRDHVEVDTVVFPVERHSRFLLCSDGLHGYLRSGDIVPTVGIGGESAVRQFVDLANQRGGKDNITVILVELN